MFISDGTQRKAVWEIALVTRLFLLDFTISGEHRDPSPPLQDPLIDEDVTREHDGPGKKENQAVTLTKTNT